MRKFQIGDEVKCINIIDHLVGIPYLNLTLNKIYTVIGIGLSLGVNYIEILNDMGVKCGFYESRFEKAEDTVEKIDFLELLKGY